jgi:hypothetical protein
MFNAVLCGACVGLTLAPEGMPFMDAATSAARGQRAYEVGALHFTMYAAWGENRVIHFPHFNH